MEKLIENSRSAFRLMPHRFLLAAVWLVLFFNPLCAQVTLELKSADVSKPEKMVVVGANCRDGGKYITTKNANFRIAERYVGEDEFEEMQIITGYPKDSDSSSSSGNDLNLLFLLDISGSMNQPRHDPKLPQAKKAIRTTLERNPNLPPNSVSFATFGNVVSKNEKLTLANFNSVVGEVRAASENETVLNCALKEKIEDFKGKKGRKIIILLSDGKNDIHRIEGRNEFPCARNPVVAQQVIDLAKTLNSQSDDDFQIYSIGFGALGAADDSGLNPQFLKDLADATPNTKDKYTYAEGVNQLIENIDRTIKDVLENILIKYNPGSARAKYKGEPRQIELTMEYAGKTYKDTIDYTWASSGVPDQIDLDNDETSADSNPFLLSLVIGLFLLVGLFFLLRYLIPFFGFLEFKRKYVMTFSEYLAKMRLGNNVKITDLYSSQELKPHDKVVTMCEHVVKLDSWVDGGDKCPLNPDSCVVGVAKYKTSKVNFFNQQGINRQLNWLLFGCAGGLLSYVFYYFLQKANPVFWVEIIESFFSKTHSQSFATQSYIGLTMGALVSMMLAWVEERATLQRGGYFFRILLRTLLGAVLSVPIFLLGEWMAKFISTSLGEIMTGLQWLFDFLARLFAWALFGSVLGWVVSIHSSVSWDKGLKGGLLAGVAAYLLNSFLQIWAGGEQWANMLAYMVYGAVLGYAIAAVVEYLQQFELVYVHPSDYAGLKFFISKWLASPGDSVTIGTASDDRVYVKGQNKQIEPHHAKLEYDVDGKVYIVPLHPVKVNGGQIKDRTPLANNDLIYLGIEGSVGFRFNSKDKTPNSGGGGGSVSSATYVPTQQDIENRSRIKITIKQ